MPDDIAQKITATIRELGGDILHHTAVIVGSTAIYLTLPSVARRPHDLDLSIPQDIYRQFRALPEWQHTETTYRTKNILRNNKCDIGIGWGGLDHAALQKRSWQTPDGLHVTNITALYAWKCTRQISKDNRDAALIYNHVHGQSLLPLYIMCHESTQLALYLPKQFRSNKTLLRLATHGLIANFTEQYSRSNHSHMSVQELTTLSQPIDSFTLLAKKIGRVSHAQLMALSQEEHEIALIALIYSDPELVFNHSIEAGYTLADAHRLADIVSKVHSKNDTDRISKLILQSSK
jgi:hypothetical protein